MSDYITIPLSKRGKNKGKYVAIIDTVDSDLAELNWLVQSGNTTNYAGHQIRLAPKRQYTELLHRVILSRKLGRELLPKEDVDHIDGNGLNNTRDNLRLASHQQNQANRGKQTNNTSGYKGVTRNGNKWHAQITVNNKKIYLGLFSNLEDAHEAYCEAAKIYFGEYANCDE